MARILLLNRTVEADREFGINFARALGVDRLNLLHSMNIKNAEVSMAEKYTRYQNTHFCLRILSNNIDKGKAMYKNNDLTSYDNLTAYRDEIEKWIDGTQKLIKITYPNQTLAEEHCPTLSKIDIDSISRTDAIKSLKEAISERVASITDLVSKTDWSES